MEININEANRCALSKKKKDGIINMLKLFCQNTAVTYVNSQLQITYTLKLSCCDVIAA